MYEETILHILCKHSDGYDGLDRSAFCEEVSDLIERLMQERFSDGESAAYEEQEMANN